MPTLNWIGKEAVVNHDKKVPFRLLRKVKSASVGKNSQNLIIHGDNLEALKALMPYYYGKIKCIYIDPPYNTGNEKWEYNDKVNSPKIRQWLGKVVGAEFEDLTRHDKWLCMMYPRLKLLSDLLREDGVIFISIDENEIHNLRIILDDIFGNSNFLTIFTWVRKKKGSNLSKEFRKTTEYIMAYKSNNKKSISLFGEPAYSEKQVPLLNRANRNSVLQFPKNKIFVGKGVNDGILKKQLFGKGELEVKLLDDIYISDKLIKTPFKLQGRFRWSQKTVDDELAFGSIFTVSNSFRINISRYNQSEKFKSPTSLITSDNGVGTNEDATKELRDLFPELTKLPFDYPKPVSLIKYLIKMVVKKDKGHEIIILDSFAGSGTTGHALLDLNKKGGNSKFILVELEDNVAKDITAERVKRAIKKYKYKDGFEFCELDKALFNEKGDIEENCSFNQLATYIYFTETQSNIDPRVIKDNYIGRFNGVDFYLFFKEKGKNVLTKKVLSTLKKNNDTKVIYADKCLIDEEILIKNKIQFKQIPYEVKVY